MKVILNESRKKVVVECFHFKNNKWEPAFILKYLNPIPTDETYTDKDWNTRIKWNNDNISTLFIDKKNLPSDVQKLDDSKICQDFRGKSIITTTFLTDE